ncbi:MAG: UbiH/UbiF/VisC/COQ6 family ubiquinone biosynthesis hydroxylase, partial [Gammaproteobacteria bacterium]|nr:UbiH/UbiF/VisC/COQ6 family ubiquinone biosynthesis hydroxylase [Gammaproteobacteria bacterium]
QLPAGAPSLQGNIDAFDSRVSALTQASCDFFAQLGVWPRIEALRSCQFQRMQVWDARGTSAIGFDADAIGAKQLGYIVENRVLTAALHATLRQREQVSIIDGVSMTQLQLPASSAVADSGCIQLDNGDSLSARLIVAADGAASPCRDALSMPLRQWDYGQDAIVCSVEMAKPHQCTAWQIFTEEGPLAFLPLARAGERGLAVQQQSRLCSIVWSQRRPRAEALMALDDDAFKQELARALEHRLGQVVTLSPRYSFPLRQQHAIEYVREGFALIADAAHTIHPLAGQGINLGFADVKALAGILDNAVASGHAPGELAVLKRYQRERKTENLAMMAIVEGFKQLYDAPVPLPLLWLRNWGMHSVDQQAWLKNRILKYAMGA